ncbi:MAG: hypothetical protein HUJ51_04800 [Eggerthellaceae bacterium]|nr:hypothetical protein [Eggerthellaceae bacterium]
MGIIIFVTLLVCSIFIYPLIKEYVEHLHVKAEKEIGKLASAMEYKQMLKQRNFWLYYVWTTMLSANGLGFLM